MILAWASPFNNCHHGFKSLYSYKCQIQFLVEYFLYIYWLKRFIFEYWRLLVIVFDNVCFVKALIANNYD